MTIRTYQGKHPHIAASAYVDESAIVIGDVTIGEHSSLWPQVVVRGDVNTIAIGARTNIQDSSVLHVTHDGKYTPGGHALTVGDNVTVGHRVILHACSVGDLCLIGMASTIMDGAVLEPKVMLGAGSLVPGGKRLESGYLYMGTPAKRVRPLSDDELESLVYSADHYVQVKNSHQQSC
jgi:carbonic anhydrase/acetyltransferase-like protein (isoleucine patch superfamily)